MNHLYRIDNICTIKLKLFLIQRERYSPHKAGSNTICDMSHAAMKKKETEAVEGSVSLKGGKEATVIQGLININYLVFTRIL